MRVLILLALISSLAWYGWTAYGRTEGTEAPTEEGIAALSEGGGMIRVQPRPDLRDPAPQVPPEESRHIDPPPVRPETDHPSEAADETLQRALPDDDLRLDLGAGRGDLVEQGRLMLHDLEGVQALLGDASELSADRKQLLFALASLVIGQKEAAAAALDQLQASTRVTSEELAFLRSGTKGGVQAQAAAASLRANPLLLGTRLGVLQRQADGARHAEHHREAAEAYSQLLREELRAPWAVNRDALAAWTEGLDIAQAQHRWNRRGVWPSYEVTVQPGDSLTRIRKRIIAERPDTVLCTGLVAAVNQTGEYLHPDQVLRIPTDPARAEVYIGARWVLYLHGEEVVAAWPCAVGREGHETPPGKYRVGVKQEKPPWMRPGKPIVPYDDPENELGTRWIAWDGSDGYGFHGTWEPQTVGTAASAGCIRMQNKDVERLFEILPQGAEIDVRP